jgi:hypothetical protein
MILGLVAGVWMGIGIAAIILAGLVAHLAYGFMQDSGE